jgi:hypothetical protein
MDTTGPIERILRIVAIWIVIILSYPPKIGQ